MGLAQGNRWTRSLALLAPAALAAVSALARPAPPGALAAAPLPARECLPAATAAAGPAGAAWYRLDPVLDPGGTLAGRQLTAGLGSARWTATLPPESFASGPVAGRVLAGDDDGQRSRLRLLDAARGCWTALGTESAVIRSAVMTADGTLVYEHRVARATRQDLGVWRRDLSRRGAAASRVLPGLAADAAAGPTYSTTLLAGDDGRLVVSSCGERSCRTRVLDLSSGQTSAVGGTGPAVGVWGGGVVALAPCDGLPCPLERVDLASGATSRLAESSGVAVLVPGLADTVALASGTGIGVMRLGADGPPVPVPGADGLAPLRLGSTADAGVEAPRGRVAVAPGGRMDDPSAVRFLDPATSRLSSQEVIP